ncbi:hypothetical protein ES703_00658 [subsurface metagenome]
MKEQTVIKNLESVRRIINRALSGRSTAVRIGHFYHFSSPAATDGKDIQLNTVFPNSDKLPLSERCAVWKGLNYHALGHILFTENTFKLRGNEKEAFDFLEDARIEWLMSYIFPGTRKYFVNNIVKMGLNDPILLWGRRYLFPINIRAPDIPRRALEITDDFIVAQTLEERENLAREFASLVSLSDISRRLTGDFDKLGRVRIEKVPVDKALEKEAKDAIEDFRKKTAEDKIEEMLKEAEQSEASADAVEAAYDNLEDAVEAEELKKDLEDVIEPQMEARKFSKFGASQIKEYKVQPDPVLVRQLYLIFNRARISTGSYYEKRLLAGRVDPREAMRHSWNGNPRIFKRFEEDQLDEAKLALALVVDKSGSMSNTDPEEITKKAGSALAWAATKAGFEVMVLAFDGRCHIVKAPYERGFRDYNYGGGTNPTRALLRAEGFLKESTHSPILILISDGEFDESAYEKLNEIAKRLGSVYVIALGWRLDQWDTAKIKPRHIKTVRELTKVIKEIIEEEEQKKVREMGRVW